MVAQQYSPHAPKPDSRLWLAICQAAQELVQENDLLPALQAIVSHVRYALDLDRAGVFYYDRPADELVRLIGVDRGGELEYDARRIPASPPDTPLRKVIHGEISYFHSHDVRIDVPEIRYHRALRAHAIVPLVASGQIIGAMAVDNLLSGRDIDEALVQPLCLFGHFAAIALHNALRQNELAQAEAQKKDFYRDVVYAVTCGKIVLCEVDDLERYWGEPVGQLSINHEEDVRGVRELVHEVARQAGLDEQRTYDLGLCASEAATNALKHGEGGRAAVARCDDRVRVRVEDHGAGIDPIALPRATLMKGFSTRASMGLGFTIMHELADRIYLYTGESGTTIILEMSATAPARAEMPFALLDCDEE